MLLLNTRIFVLYGKKLNNVKTKNTNLIDHATWTVSHAAMMDHDEP